MTASCEDGRSVYDFERQYLKLNGSLCEYMVQKRMLRTSKMYHHERF